MEYVNLDITPVINGVTYSTHINILDITGNTCNVNISNAEAEIHKVIIVNNDIETCIKVYFDGISDKELKVE
jgi:hypothetical protein